MLVNFYNFSKKENSTAQPPASALIKSTDCYLKDGCSILAPSIRLAWAADDMMPNYAQIPAWGRYYNITNIEYQGSAIIIDMTVDALASYKDQIGASTQYVVRAAAEKNELIIDSLYATQTRPTVNSIAANTVLNQQGTYIVGILGQGGTGASKGVTYYAMDATHMKAMQDWLNTNAASAALAGDLASFVQLTAADLIEQFTHVTDYIRTCMWLPIRYTGTYTDVVFGNFIVTGDTVQGIELDDANMLMNFASFTIPAHPQAASNGAWMNAEPYTRHTLTVPALGSVPLSSDIFTAGDTVDVQAELSLIDGSIEFLIYRNQQTDGRTAGRYYGNIGVSIPLAQQRSAVQDVFANVVTAVRSAGAKDYIGAGMGVINALDAASPQPQILTSGGTGYHVQGNTLNADLTSVFYLISDTDNTNHGSPLCARRQISTLAGYVQTEGAALALAATEDEKSAILRQMDSGFFYE